MPEFYLIYLPDQVFGGQNSSLEGLPDQVFGGQKSSPKGPKQLAPPHIISKYIALQCVVCSKIYNFS